MGSYATTTSISELLPNYLVGNTTASDTAGMGIFSRHIDRAEGLVNASIANRYDPSAWLIATTTTNVPPLVRQLSEDIACFYAIRGASTQDSQLKNQNLAQYEHAFDILKELVAGSRTLTYTNGSSVPARTSTMFISSTQGYTPIFGLDDETAWTRDQNEIDDQSAARS